MEQASRNYLNQSKEWAQNFILGRQLDRPVTPPGGFPLLEIVGHPGWNITFRRHLNDWEVERLASLLGFLETFNGIATGPDSLKWKHSDDGNPNSEQMLQEGEQLIIGRKSKAPETHGKVRSLTK